VGDTTFEAVESLERRNLKGCQPRARASRAFWEREYFDTLIRDEEHLKRAVRYTENNPVKAALVAERKKWRWGSAGHRDEYERLHFERPL
jgi:hypothetical protein